MCHEKYSSRLKHGAGMATVKLRAEKRLKRELSIAFKHGMTWQEVGRIWEEVKSEKAYARGARELYQLKRMSRNKITREKAEAIEEKARHITSQGLGRIVALNPEQRKWKNSICAKARRVLRKRGPKKKKNIYKFLNKD